MGKKNQQPTIIDDSEYANRLHLRRRVLQASLKEVEDELADVEKLLFSLTGFLGQSARTQKTKGDKS